MKTKYLPIINILIQLAWLGLALLLGTYISLHVFSSRFWGIAFSGVLSLTIYFLMAWITYTIKATKDPKVKAANKLRMSILHYKKYEKIWDEQLDCARRGVEPPNRLDEIPNMNEWYRFLESKNTGPKTIKDYAELLNTL